MKFQPITNGTDHPISAAGPAAPATGLDVATVAALGQIQLTVNSLTCDAGEVPKARITIYDSVNAFADELPVCMFNVAGPVDPSTPVTLSAVAREIPSHRAGTPFAKFRAVVEAIEGTNAALSFTATIES